MQYRKQGLYMTRPLIIIVLTCLTFIAFVEQVVGDPVAGDHDTTVQANTDQATAPSINEYCPVMPDSLATSDWSTVYRGKQINFCCNNCVDSFRANPKGYLERLPHVPGEDIAAVPIGEQIRTQFRNAVEWARSPGGRVVCVFVIASLLFGAWRKLQQRRAKRNQEPLTVRPVMAEMLVFGLLATVIHLGWNNSQLETEVIKQRVLRVVHHSTYHDHGYPPQPPRPSAENRLAARFYRGNDERSEFLYNGGNYQTATFDIAIQREDGSQVQFGDDVSGQELFVSYSITRPKQSPDRLYATKIMDRIYLTKEYGELMGYDRPVRDFLPIKRLDDFHWNARYSLGVVSTSQGSRLDPATAAREQLLRVPGMTEQFAEWFLEYRKAGYPIRGRADLRHAGIEGEAEQALAAAFGHVTEEGNVYICEANFGPGGRQMGARFHYGIGYKLFVKDGVVLPDSDIWMGPLSRSQKAAKGQIPNNQWLSETPLPSVPERQELSDELLGIDEWE